MSCILMSFFDDLFKNQNLFQILHISITIGNFEYVVGVSILKNLCDVEHPFYFLIKKKYKISCVKTVFSFS